MTKLRGDDRYNAALRYALDNNLVRATFLFSSCLSKKRFFQIFLMMYVLRIA
eukprot:COSAG06_NODE_5123_length_3702_cov_3.658895_1_plen_52_part_00